MSRPNPNQITRNAKRARLIRDWRALAASRNASNAGIRADAPEGDAQAQQRITNQNEPRGRVMPETTPQAAISQTRGRLYGKAEQCRVCYETFTGSSAADAHRIVARTYDLVRIEGKLIRTLLERDEHGRVIVPAKVRLVSSGNQVRRCLTPDEIEAKGFRRNKRGQWGRHGADGEWWSA